MSSAATASNLSLNQSNYATVDSVANGSTATVRVYGSGGVGTSWTSILGNSSKVIASGTIMNVAYATNGFVVWDGQKYQLKPQLAQTFPDTWVPVGKVSVIANASGLVAAGDSCRGDRGRDRRLPDHQPRQRAHRGAYADDYG